MASDCLSMADLELEQPSSARRTSHEEYRGGSHSAKNKANYGHRCSDGVMH